MSYTYTLKHTAEAIDYKLNLIDKNKNLLPYPYTTNFSEIAGLEDVGDGSILTTNNTTAATTTEVLLATCALPAGEYAISLTTTDLTENLVHNASFSLEVKSANSTIATALPNSYDGGNSESSQFKLDAETVVEVYLNTPSSFDINLLIKPQIEEGTEKTTWVPNMDKIGSYVDRRFNGTNAKIKAHVENKNNPHDITCEQIGAVPSSRTINNKPLSTNIGLTYDDVGAAPENHGDHVPKPATGSDISNKKFLRNDNTWQEVTPANIGAVPTSRTVNGKALSYNISLSASDVGAAATSHEQSANSITQGTFAGQVVANSSGQAVGTSLLRNSKLVSAETNPTVSGEICWQYE